LWPSVDVAHPSYAELIEKDRVALDQSYLDSYELAFFHVGQIDFSEKRCPSVVKEVEVAVWKIMKCYDAAPFRAWARYSTELSFFLNRHAQLIERDLGIELTLDGYGG
jgi:hypothetical protein